MTVLAAAVLWYRRSQTWSCYRELKEKKLNFESRACFEILFQCLVEKKTKVGTGCSQSSWAKRLINCKCTVKELASLNWVKVKSSQYTLADNVPSLHTLLSLSLHLPSTVLLPALWVCWERKRKKGRNLIVYREVEAERGRKR